MIERYTADNAEALAQLTAMEPIGRLGQPEEVADVMVRLCSDEASFVTGVAMPVDGAMVAQ
ncbi:MAG: SDR family oxidoreductase [Chloroflexota bacterium]|nr:SDR family oxidoreductase [Chloroflexota bacterium]